MRLFAVSSVSATNVRPVPVTSTSTSASRQSCPLA
jgi:hypothetical protein